MTDRLLPGIALCALLGAVAWSAVQFGQSIGMRVARDDPAPVRAGAGRGAAFDAESVAPEAAGELPFLPIFGVPRPAPEPATETPRPAPTRFSYSLKGVAASGRLRWAILRGAEGDILVREGDTVAGGAKIVAIHADGVDVDLGSRILTLNFSEARPVAMGDVAAGATRPGHGDPLPRPQRQKVIYQDMSPAELLAALEAAEQRRRERGWVTE